MVEQEGRENRVRVAYSAIRTGYSGIGRRHLAVTVRKIDQTVWLVSRTDKLTGLISNQDQTAGEEACKCTDCIL